MDDRTDDETNDGMDDEMDDRTDGWKASFCPQHPLIYKILGNSIYEEGSYMFERES
jgi:hypothetical protein